MRTEEMQVRSVWLLMRHEEITGEEDMVESTPIHVYSQEEHAMQALANANERAEVANLATAADYRAYYSVSQVSYTPYAALVTVPYA